MSQFLRWTTRENPLVFPEAGGREIRRCSSGKRRFLDKTSCEVRIKLLGKNLFAYHCVECDQWHMTSKAQVK